MSRWPLWIGIGACGVGGIGGLLFQIEALPNRVFVGQVVVDLAALTFWGGLGIGVLAGLLWALGRWGARLRLGKPSPAYSDLAGMWPRFLRALEHELRNPLAILYLGLNRLRTGGGLDEEAREALDRIAEQATRLQRLMEGLRRLVDLEEGRMERIPVDLRGVLEEALALIQESPAGAARGVALQWPRVPWPPPPIHGDPDLLVLAFRNLLDNALKFTRPEDPAEVRVFEGAGGVYVEVADGGPGIPEDDLPHVLEPLYRGRNAQGVPGSGLGLALVHRLIRGHGGTIEVRSRPGCGTAVRVWLPVEGTPSLARRIRRWLGARNLFPVRRHHGQQAQDWETQA